MQNIHLFNLTLFEIGFYFLYWSAFGWILEVIVRTLETGEFENRGFLNSPICPIYGFGVLIVYTTLSSIKSIFILFVLSVLLCSIIELFVGLGLQRMFHAKWWDYSHEKFNYKGYICLKISLLWGVGCLLVVRTVHPAIIKLVTHIPYIVGNIILLIVSIMLIIDTVCSVAEILNFNNKLRQIDKFYKKLNSSSIKIGGNISGEVQEIKQKYDKLLEQAKKNRFVKSFPNMKSIKYNDALKLIKKKINKKNNN
ncbi:MAG: putative ABC transporter permease [Clostridiales bacterium]|nr:putative ABC transporter permease [Clostridiales bacterium]